MNVVNLIISYKGINTAVNKKPKNDFLPSDVKNVIIHDKSVIVNLNDGRKGISKLDDKDTFDEFTGFVIAYYKAKHTKTFELKKVLKGCVKSANKKGYKQAILKNN
ncbi:protein of unknown function [Ruminococcaceae bacterium BL-6]|nr:protein of unknown function [Ruminococcaceae bacterium BL-6]